MENYAIKEVIEIICVNLPVLRSMQNLTQQNLAEIIGTSRQGIINFEHQNKKLTKSMLIAIVTYFSLRGRSAAFLNSLGLYRNSYINSLGFDEKLCNYIIENDTLED
jgi:DNA-binding XRE family transcriptional regulator